MTARFVTTLAGPETSARLERYINAADEYVDDVPQARLLGGSLAGVSFRLSYACTYGRVIVRGRIRERHSHTQVSLMFREEPIRLLRPALVALLALGGWYFLRDMVRVKVDVLDVGVPIAFGVAGLFVPRWGTSPGFADAVVAELSRLLTDERKGGVVREAAQQGVEADEAG